MSSKKDIFGNWRKKWMCGDYQLINKQTKLNQYALSASKEIFDAIGHAKVLVLWI